MAFPGGAGAGQPNGMRPVEAFARMRPAPAPRTGLGGRGLGGEGDNEGTLLAYAWGMCTKACQRGRYCLSCAWVNIVV